MDPQSDFDWATHWRSLVESSGLHGVDRQDAQYWDQMAGAYDYYVSQAKTSPFLETLAPFVAPSKTLIDVGCGPGTHLVWLAARLARVIGVEPSAGMRQHIPKLENVTVIAARWEDAEVKVADLVVSSLVLNFVSDPVPFIRKMETHARERCFLHLLDDSGHRPTDELFRLLTGHARPRSPRFLDVYNLLRWMGIRPDVISLDASDAPRWETFDAALEDCRARLAPVWNEEVGRAWLVDHLRSSPGGGLYLGEGRPTAVAHWKPHAAD